MIFPALVLGPSMVGILLTRTVDGTSGLRDLFSRMRRVHFPARWYAALPVAPVLVLIAWAYSHTNSVLLAQLLHAGSTGSLVIFSPLA